MMSEDIKEIEPCKPGFFNLVYSEQVDANGKFYLHGLQAVIPTDKPSEIGTKGYRHEFGILRQGNSELGLLDMFRLAEGAYLEGCLKFIHAFYFHNNTVLIVFKANTKNAVKFKAGQITKSFGIGIQTTETPSIDFTFGPLSHLKDIISQSSSAISKYEEEDT